MSDPRRIPANGRVAAEALRGQVTAERFTAGEPAQVALPLADLLRRPEGPRDRQLLMGDAVTVFERHQGWAYVQAKKDGYVGYVPADALAAPSVPNHFIAVPASHALTEPDIRAPEAHRLYLGARLNITAHHRDWYETAEGGFVPRRHLRPLDRPFSDPVTVAQMLYGAPYLWGGNTVAGIDCSGLVQAAMLACGIACPGDSDMQETELGTPLSEDAPLERGDLLFWKGHVAMAVDGETLIHANAHHMAVAYEPAARAIARIAAQGGGPVTTRRRLGAPSLLAGAGDGTGHDTAGRQDR